MPWAVFVGAGCGHEAHILAPLWSPQAPPRGRAIFFPVKPKDFEQAVLDLAMTTRVPLSRANILFYTGAASKQADKWLDAMMADGLLDIDSDDEGELIYVLKGASRPLTGPTALVRCPSCGRATGAGTRCPRCNQAAPAPMDKLRTLREELDQARRASTALTALHKGSQMLSSPQQGDKSLIAAGALGLLTGPFGWLYAAPLREAVPAILVFLILCKVLPTVLFMVLPVLPASALIGALYAWKYNRTGRRSGLLDDGDDGGDKSRGR